MNTTTEQVFVEALSLPTRSRAELAQKLLASLGQEIGSPEIEAAWTTEALDRCKAHDEGRITERDSADVLRDAYRRVK
jgi:Putative addiction module component